MNKKIILSIILLISPFFVFSKPKILHLSFHQGCINDFKEVAQELDLDVTSCFVQNEPRFSGKNFDGVTGGNTIYNIGHDRAERVWNRHKSFFDQFDVIVTSDTAPLSRIFLQNGWQKQLIIWVCNRFDYYDHESRDCPFPDGEYYNLIQNAAHQKNVKIISYTPYEHHYSRRKGIDWGTFTIKPIGCAEKELVKSSIPESVEKSKTFFLYPRLGSYQVQYIQQQCSELDIPTYSGVYNGPDDLTDFKGLIYFPYAWSNLALFENLQRGIVHFVPSEQFILNNANKPIRFLTLNEFHLCEWYFPEYRDLFVYFDSWEDLKEKIEITNFKELKNKIIEKGKSHRKEMLERWYKIFSEL